MTLYTLSRNVAFEGSSILGVFPSFDEVLGHINALDGYLMDEFSVSPEDLKHVDCEWTLERVHNATAVWSIEGPSDISFTIIAIAFGE